MKSKTKLERKDQIWKQKYGCTYTELLNKNKKGSKGFPSFRKFLVYFGDIKKRYIFLLFIGIFSAVLSLSSPYFLQNTIDNITKSVWDMALYSALGLLIFSIIGGCFDWGYNAYSNNTYNILSHKIRLLMMQNISNVKTHKFDETSSGMIINRIVHDANNFSRNITGIVYRGIWSLSKIAYVLYAFFINVWLGAFLFVTGFVKFLINYIYTKKFQKIYQRRELKIDDTITSQQTEFVRGVRDVKFLNIKEKLFNNFETTSNYVKNASTDRDKALQNVYNIEGVFTYFVIFAFIVLSIFLIQSNQLTLGGFTVLFIYRNNVYEFFNFLSSILGKLQSAEGHAERMCEILDDKIYPKETFGTKVIENPQGKIEFKKVKFAYNDKQKLFKDLSFVIEPNECVGFVGKSGEGKSTIISLIPKLYEVNDGKILIDDININDLTENSLRDNISVVQQAPYIFNLSIYENLLYVKPNATEDEIIDACKKAQLYEFIKTLPNKFETIVGEGGVVLSGGQRQRLAIARTLLQNSKIIIFDEATSALDNESQENIKKAISSIKKQKTILIIAHRLTTVKDCDKIFVIDNNKIIAEGKHNELMKTCEIYKNLYKNEDLKPQ